MPVKLTPFWSEVFSSYAELRTITVTTKEVAKEQIINSNREILIGGKSVFSRELVEKNADTVGDWFDASGKPWPYEFFRRSRGLNISWFRYMQILSAIPKEWKQLLRTSNVGMETVADVFALPPPKLAKAMFLSKKWSEPAAISAWRIFENYDWSQYFTLARKMCKESKMQVFQFKILHRIIPTKQ